MGLATVIIKTGQIPPPTCPSRFHLGLLHTILDERLGIKRIAMKLLTSTAVSLLLIGLTMSGTAYSQVPSWEREALMALYNATRGYNWSIKVGWNGAAGTECDWYGVGCSYGHVSRLILNDNSLSGSIPAELGNLTNLTSLYLNINSLTGSIPPELGNLTNLTFFSLANNSLSGSIPAELGNLTNLTILYLNNNSLTGSIPAELGNLTNLTDFYLNFNSLTGNIPSELGNLTNLIGLSLGDNFLTGPLPQWLSDTAIPYVNVTDAFNEWPSPYNGVTPDSSFNLEFNNIGTFNSSDSTIYTCLRVFTDGLPGSVGGIGEFDIGLTIVSLDEGTVQVTKYREFNAIGALNENAELPDCSGKFETTTGIYADIIQAGDQTLETTFSLTDSSNLILTLQSYETITAPN